MRVLFLGTPQFAATVLETLLESEHDVVGVVAQPSRPTGRGLKLVDPPAARLAIERGIPLFQPEKLHSAASLERLRALEPEIAVTAAFGRILRKKLLGLPPRGCWNVHTSLLPKHRGAAPVTSAILAGDAWTGVTLFELDPGMDTGPIVLQEMTAIAPAETAGDLTERLATMGGALLVRGLDLEGVEPLERRPQLESGASYSRMLTKEDGRLLWNRPAEQVYRQLRAVSPWPGGFTFFGGKRVRVHDAVPVHEMPPTSVARLAAPGTILDTRQGIDVACRPGALRLVEVQSEGKKRAPAVDWVRGARVEVGGRFDAPEIAGDSDG